MRIRICGGKFRNRPLKSPETNKTRPTSGKTRETIFNILSHQVADAQVLDLYAGSGALGFEALSRGANSVTFVEMDIDAKNAIKHNIDYLNVSEQTQIIGYDVKRALKTLESRGVSYDLIFIDPPYHFENEYRQTMLMLDNGSILKPGGLVVVEQPEKKNAIPDLQNLTLVKSRQSGNANLSIFTKE